MHRDLEFANRYFLFISIDHKMMKMDFDKNRYTYITIGENVTMFKLIKRGFGMFCNSIHNQFVDKYNYHLN